MGFVPQMADRQKSHWKTEMVEGCRLQITESSDLLISILISSGVHYITAVTALITYGPKLSTSSGTGNLRLFNGH